MKSSRAWVYAVCQLGGWGLYALINTVLLLLAPGRGLGSPWVWWLFSLAAAAFTHLARAVLPLRAWARLPLASLAPRVLATAFGLGLAQNVGVFALSVFALKLYTVEQASVSAFIVSAVFWTLLMGMWLVLYFAIHAVERARHAELERWKLEAAVQASELRFLKAQLQPHFLFNCLNSVRALISEDPARAQEVVTRLSALLRYALAARSPEILQGLDRPDLAHAVFRRPVEPSEEARHGQPVAAMGGAGAGDLGGVLHRLHRGDRVGAGIGHAAGRLDESLERRSARRRIEANPRRTRAGLRESLGEGGAGTKVGQRREGGA